MNKIMSITDKDRIDFLQSLNDREHFTGKAVLRESSTGRGWRLHETTHEDATKDVRETIDNAIKNGIK